MRRLRVKEIAQAKGYTMARLARETSIDIKTLQKIWHKQNYNPLLTTLDKIAGALGVSTRDLLAEDEDRDSATSEKSE